MEIKEKKLSLRKLNSEKTRKKLFDISLKLFGKYGFDNVTIDDITKEAGVSKGSFYFHFKTKESVIIELIKEADDLYGKWYKKVDYNMDSEKKLIEMVMISLNFIQSRNSEIEAALYASQIRKGNTHEPFLSDWNRPIYKITEKIIEEAQQRGLFRTDLSARELTDIFTRMLRSMIFNWCLNAGSYDLPEDARRYLSILLPSFRKAHEGEFCPQG